MANWMSPIEGDFANLPADKKKLKYPPPADRKKASDCPLFAYTSSMKSEVEPSLKATLRKLQDNVHRLQMVEGFEDVAEQLQAYINYSQDVWNHLHGLQEAEIKPLYEEFQAARRPNRKKGDQPDANQ